MQPCGDSRIAFSEIESKRRSKNANGKGYVFTQLGSMTYVSALNFTALRSLDFSGLSIFCGTYFPQFVLCVTIDIPIILRYNDNTKATEDWPWTQTIGSLQCRGQSRRNICTKVYCNFSTGDKRRAKVNASPSFTRSGMINGMTHQARTVARPTAPFAWA